MLQESDRKEFRANLYVCISAMHLAISHTILLASVKNIEINILKWRVLLPVNILRHLEPDFQQDCFSKRYYY